MPLTDADVDAFVRDGVLKVPAAFPRATADACRALLWEASGCREDDPASWTQPVIRLDYRGDGPFGQISDTPPLREAFDALAGRGRRSASPGPR